MEFNQHTNKRTRVLLTALELFNERGVQNTSTAIIAQTAGVATGTMFHHFKSKGALIQQIFIYTRATLVAELALIPGDLGLKERFYLAFDKYIHWATSHPDFFNFNRMFLNSPYAGQVSDAEMREQAFVFIGLIEEGIASKQVRAMDPYFIYEMVSSMLNAAATHALRHPDTLRYPNLMQQSFDMIWNSITPMSISS